MRAPAMPSLHATATRALPPPRRLAAGRLAAVFLMAAALHGAAAAQAPHRVFWSGHSLTAQPLPSQFEAVAASLGSPLRWNRQYLEGSSILQRTRGEGAPGSGWRAGLGADERPIDAHAELLRPAADPQAPYDLLLITEQHALIDSLLHNRTPRWLRAYHDRFIEGNPAGRTWFYEPWLQVSDKDDPRRWIAFERAASPLWGCVVTRVNANLAAEGRSDRIATLPTGAALVELVERATQGAGLPGLSGPTPRATLDRLLHDRVHPTPLGFYFLALYTYAMVFERSPEGAWAPPGTDAATVRTLQRQAWEIAAARLNSPPPALSLEQCRAELAGPFLRHYLGYLYRTQWRGQPATPREWARRVKNSVLAWWALARDTPEHPLHEEAASPPAR
jgi:hypothetical protein